VGAKTLVAIKRFRAFRVNRAFFYPALPLNAIIIDSSAFGRLDDVSAKRVF
jgi:hypothetical protein